MFKIDDGVPLPAFRWDKFPIPDLEVGQSLLVGPDDAQSVRRIAWWRGKQLGRKYVTRKVEGGVRVWRVG